MKRAVTIKAIIDFGDDPMPSDRTIEQAIEEHLEGKTVWRGQHKGHPTYHQPTAVIDQASIKLGEVVAP